MDRRPPWRETVPEESRWLRKSAKRLEERRAAAVAASEGRQRELAREEATAVGAQGDPCVSCKLVGLDMVIDMHVKHACVVFHVSCCPRL